MKNLLFFMLGWMVFLALIDKSIVDKQSAMVAFGCAMVIWSSISDALFPR